MDVGIAGVGKMGAAIALRLMEVGHKVTVWNRSADKAKPLAEAGAAVAKAARTSSGRIMRFIGRPYAPQALTSSDPCVCSAPRENSARRP